MGTDLNIGHATAYAYAKSKGYTGTEEQFATELAQFAQNAQQVAEDKAAVERLVDEFLNTTAPAVIQDVTDEGTSQVERVANAGTAQVTRVGQAGDTQIDGVAAAGTTQIGLVTAEGTTQVTRVQAKGTEVINSIPADYTSLTQEVSDLNQQTSDIEENQIPELKSATTKLNDFCVTLGMDDVVLDNNDFIGGAWLNAQGYRNDGNYGKFRVHLTAIPLKNYDVNIETSDANTKVSLALFSDDSGETFLAGYPQNVSVSNSIYHIDTHDILSRFPATKTIRINIYEYDGSSYSSTTDLVLSTVYVSDKTIIDRVDELDNAVNTLNLHETDYMFPVNEKNIINIIGDSITAGVYSDNAMIDSYAGILRNLMSKHLGNHLNFGFAPFTIQDGYQAGYWTTNILQIGDRGTAVRINSASGSPMFGKMYGTEGFELVDTDSVFRFKILDNTIQKFQLAYVSGVNSTINVYKRKNAVSTLLLTIDCSGETVEPAYSDVIDLGELNDSNTQIYLYLGSGDGAYISGIQIINDANYATFNNYSLPGAATVHQTDVLIQSEIDCDLLIWALGFNDRNNPTSFKANIERWTPMIQAKRCYCVVLDFQWDRTNGCKPVLKQMAKDLNCIYLDFAEIVPRKANGQIINNFLAADGVHPVALGHRFIAEYIAKTIGLDFTSKMQVLGE